jgi:hypothetical protein
VSCAQATLRIESLVMAWQFEVLPLLFSLLLVMPVARLHRAPENTIGSGVGWGTAVCKQTHC